MNIYIATKLFSFFDRRISYMMYEITENVIKELKIDNYHIFLPFKESNKKVSMAGNVSKNIFDADINSLKNIDVLIGIVDGLSLDAGIGFEVGYCIAKRIPIILFSTDFINSKIGNFQKFQYDPICKDNVNIFKYEYINNNSLSYVDELDYNIKAFKEYVKSKIKETLKNCQNRNKFFSEFENDVFIDFSGMKYEWNKKIVNNLENKLNEQNYKCIQSDRYSSNFNAVKELEKLISSKILVINYDENEPNFGSSILQGIAYYYNKIIIAYETHQVDYYVDGGQHMGVNLMLEQSATKICRDYNELEKVVLEELKKVVKK